MFDRILLDLDPNFLSWESWLYIVLIVVSVLGITKGRSACYLVALAAVFMFLESTSVVFTANALIQREYAAEAEAAGVCYELENVDAKKVENSLGEQDGELDGEPFSGKIKPFHFNFEYQDCIEQWVNEHDHRMQWLYVFSFLFWVVCELLRATAFLSVLAMLNDRRLISTKDVICWYKKVSDNE